MPVDSAFRFHGLEKNFQLFWVSNVRLLCVCVCVCVCVYACIVVRTFKIYSMTIYYHYHHLIKKRFPKCIDMEISLQSVIK